MLERIYQALIARPRLAAIDAYGGIKDFMRPESLAEDVASVVIIPLTSPLQADFASDRPLRKKFIYQINVEACDYDTTKALAHEVELALLGLDFFQETGGLDTFFEETNRYVDARTYRGFNQVYEEQEEGDKIR